MSSTRDAARRQRRRELDARRSKSRIRLGSCLEDWGELKEKLGFGLHSELAQYLLESYFSNICISCSGAVIKMESLDTFLTSKESLNHLVTLVHNHSQQCHFTPIVQAAHSNSPNPHSNVVNKGRRQTAVQVKLLAGADPGLRWECEGGHVFVWCPSERVDRAKKSNLGAREGAERVNSQSETLPALRKTRAKPSRRCRKDGERAKELSTNRTRRDPSSNSPTPDAEHEPAEEVTLEHRAAEDGNSATDKADVHFPCEECEIWEHSSNWRSNRGNQEESEREKQLSILRGLIRNIRRGTDDDISQIGAKRIRKATQREILPCEFDGCGKIFSTRQYLNHHMKYQHFQQKTFACSHPTCGKSFNFKKHLKEHEKLHSNKRDYICEFCARAFRTSSNLIIHRRIHTGEKPLQCEVCGFTCRQKASLNWHMRKHNAESSYLYACEICGKRFEKRDNVAAHRNKSHPQCPGPAPPPSCHPEPLADGTRAGAQPSPS
uniref:C2H2-type domain-containing protein n=1 Tax=Lepisosteus oculatus TaxID=7918 RepID=W5MVL9_LEPOC